MPGQFDKYLGSHQARSPKQFSPKQYISIATSPHRASTQDREDELLERLRLSEQEKDLIRKSLYL